jgi:hypothetical protein
VSGLYAIHDWEPSWGGIIRDASSTGYAVISEEIGDDPTDKYGIDYRNLAAYGVTPIVRLNYSHHGEGTIPLPSRYNAFAERCANYVTASQGCTHWLIGNEPNLAAERYANVPITPGSYAECFNKCRLQIKHRGTQHIIIPAAVAPYNNDTGWCMDYWREMLSAIVMNDGGADGLAIHTYSRGPIPASVRSEDKMGAPYQMWHNGFRAYRDFLTLVPAIMRALPVFITETDQLEPWADTNSGWVRAAYAEIDEWNHGAGQQRIHCLALYRWLKHDQWYIKGKNGVIDDFRSALTFGYEAPNMPPTPTPPTPTPEPPQPMPPTPEPPPIFWDKRLTVRGCTLQPALMPTDVAPLVTVGRWFNKDEAQGRTNIFVRLLDEQGKLAVGVPVTQFWSSGSATRPTERKVDPWLASKGLGAEYSLDFAMYNVAPSYGIRIEGDYRGDVVNGCGLGSIEQPDYKIHTAYFFEWQLSSSGITVPPTPIPAPVGDLTHPLPGAVITQHWGESAPEYARFGMWGHNGCDLGNRPLRTPIRSIANGIVAYSDFDVAYGHYVRADYRELDCYAMYCHLDEPGAPVGTRLNAGDTVGLLGTSGNSTGVHLHLEIRLQNKDGTYREDTPMPKGRVDPETWAAMHNLKL